MPDPEVFLQFPAQQLKSLKSPPLQRLLPNGNSFKSWILEVLSVYLMIGIFCPLLIPATLRSNLSV